MPREVSNSLAKKGKENEEGEVSNSNNERKTRFHFESRNC